MTDMNQILSSPTFKVAEAKGVLAKLFRLILRDTKMTSEALHYRMQEYLNDPANNIDIDPQRKSYTRQNFMNALSGEHLTWRSFFRGIKMLAPIKFKLTFEAEWAGGVVTESFVTVKLKDADPTDLQTLVDIADDDQRKELLKDKRMGTWEDEPGITTVGLESEDDMKIPWLGQAYLTDFNPSDFLEEEELEDG